MRAHPWLIVGVLGASFALVRTTSEVAGVTHELVEPPTAIGGGPGAVDEGALDASRATVAREAQNAESSKVHATCANHTDAAEHSSGTTSVSNGVAPR